MFPVGVFGPDMKSQPSVLGPHAPSEFKGSLIPPLGAPRPERLVSRPSADEETEAGRGWVAHLVGLVPRIGAQPEARDQHEGPHPAQTEGPGSPAASQGTGGVGTSYQAPGAMGRGIRRGLDFPERVPLSLLPPPIHPSPTCHPSSLLPDP